MNRTVGLLLASIALSACSSSTPAPAPEPAASAATTTAHAAASAVPAASTSTSPPAASASASAAPSLPAETPPPVDATPKSPAASATLKATLVDQVKGTPLAVLYVTDAAAATCDAKPVEGATMLEVTLYWTPGDYDIGTRTKTAAVRAREFSGGKWKTLPDVVKGDIQVRDAPSEPGKTGRIHVHGDRAGKPLDEELDVLVCAPFALPKPKGH